MGLLSWLKLRKQRSIEDLAATEHIYLAGWSESCPHENSEPTAETIDRSHPDFQRGQREGAEMFNRLKDSNPELFVNGVIRDDSQQA